jgi:protein-tyrosine-phosphatase
VYRVVLVCTGNTCRSPLAEALLRQALAAHGVTQVEVSSAGTGAWEGAPASEGAYLVALENGLDLSGHRARLLTAEVIAGSDLILTMARHHRARVLELGAGGQVHLLGDYAGRSGAAAEVADPFGADLEMYRQTRDELAALTQVVAARLAGERADDRR